MDTSLIDVFNGRDIRKKVYTSLLGVCQGLIADNNLNEQEFYYLRQWLLQNEDYLMDWPCNIIMKHINEILADGIVTEAELENLKDVLAALIGGTLEETGSVSTCSTSLPVNTDAPILFNEQTFCFTGKMIFGPRKNCMDATKKHGALVIDTIRQDLNYLVIGLIASDSWANTSYGRKIEKAVELQENGHPLYIISEKMWQDALNGLAIQKVLN